MTNVNTIFETLRAFIGPLGGAITLVISVVMIYVKRSKRKQGRIYSVSKKIDDKAYIPIFIVGILLILDQSIPRADVVALEEAIYRSIHRACSDWVFEYRWQHPEAGPEYVTEAFKTETKTWKVTREIPYPAYSERSWLQMRPYFVYDNPLSTNVTARLRNKLADVSKAHSSVIGAKFSTRIIETLDRLKSNQDNYFYSNNKGMTQENRQGAFEGSINAQIETIGSFCEYVGMAIDRYRGK